MTIDKDYALLELNPYKKFAEDRIRENMKHLYTCCIDSSMTSPFNFKSELYRQIGSTTFFCVKCARSIMGSKQSSVFIRSYNKDCAEQVLKQIKLFIEKLGGRLPEHLKCGGYKARIPFGYHNYDDRTSQEEFVTCLFMESNPDLAGDY